MIRFFLGLLLSLLGGFANAAACGSSSVWTTQDYLTAHVGRSNWSSRDACEKYVALLAANPGNVVSGTGAVSLHSITDFGYAAMCRITVSGGSSPGTWDAADLTLSFCDPGPLPSGGGATVTNTVTVPEWSMSCTGDCNITLTGIPSSVSHTVTLSEPDFNSHLVDFGVNAQSIMTAMGFGLGFILLLWSLGYVCSVALAAIKRV